MYANSKKTIPFFICFMLVFMLLNVLMFNDLTAHAEYVTIETWESYNLGADSGTNPNGIISWSNYSEDIALGEIDTGSLRDSGSKLLYTLGDGTIGEESIVYINVTGYSYIGSISFNVEITEVVAVTGRINITFYNGATEVLGLAFTCNPATNNVNYYYKDTSNVSNAFAGADYSGDYYINITHVSGNTMNYSFNNITDVTQSVEDSCRTISDWITFDQIRIVNENQGYEFEIGDIKIDESSSAGDTSDTTQYGDISDYEVYCTNPEGAISSGFEGRECTDIFNWPFPDIIVCNPNRYLEGLIGRVSWDSDKPIRGFDIYLTTVQRDYISSNLSDYFGYLNGVSIGVPDYFFEVGEGYTLMRFLFDATPVRTDELLVFEISCSKSYNNYSWYPAYEYDIITGSMYTHNNSNNFGNGLDGTGIFLNLLGQLAWGDPITGHSWSCVYYTFDAEDCSYTDGLILDQHEGLAENTFYAETTIDVSGFLSTLVPDSYLQLNYAGSQITTGAYSGNGLKVSDDGDCDFQESFYISASSVGSWNVTLMRNSLEIDSINFTVLAPTADMNRSHIMAFPTNIFVGETLTIRWLYNYTYYSYYGEVYMSDYSSFDQDRDTLLQGFINSNGERSYTPRFFGERWFHLVVDKDGTKIVVATSKPIFIGDYGNDEIRVRDSELVIGANADSVEQFFSGEHQHIGSDVVVLDNNEIIMTLMYQGSFSFSKEYFEEGHHWIVLSIRTDNYTFVNLSETEFTISKEVESSTSWYGLPYWLPFLIGIFITLLITLSPLITITFVNRRTKTDVHVPDLLYVGFFFLGMITSVVIGFLPSYLPFVILFAMIVYFAVQWLYGKRSTAVGGE
jgi:hypothetical protein